MKNQPSFFMIVIREELDLSESIYGEMKEVLKETEKMVDRCKCEHGCPSCIGAETAGDYAKKDALQIIKTFLNSAEYNEGMEHVAEK